MDAMQAHWRIRGDHEIERGARWPAIKKRCGEAARRNSLVADKCDAHETARGMRLQLEELMNRIWLAKPRVLSCGARTCPTRGRLNCSDWFTINWHSRILSWK